MNYAIVTAYTPNYSEGYEALVRSLKAVMPDVPVFTAGPEIDRADFPYYTDRQQTGPWLAKGARHKLAGKVAADHDATLVLDADMLVLQDLTMFFDVCAHAEVLIGASNGSNIYFDNRPYIDKPFYHPKTISNVPLFVPRKYAYLYAIIHELFAKHAAAEFDVTNAVIHKECLDRLLVLPPQNWTNIHHYMMKADTHIKQECGTLTAQGMPVYAMHGKLWNTGYQEGLVTRMDKHLDGFSVLKAKSIARKARDIMVAEWNRCRRL